MWGTGKCIRFWLWYSTLKEIWFWELPRSHSKVSLACEFCFKKKQTYELSAKGHTPQIKTAWNANGWWGDLLQARNENNSWNELGGFTIIFFLSFHLQKWGGKKFPPSIWWLCFQVGWNHRKQSFCSLNEGDASWLLWRNMIFRNISWHRKS